MELPKLTREQIERAERREGIYHPITNILDRYNPQITRFNQGSSTLTGDAYYKFCKENLGFLADTFEETEDFTLRPLEIIGIWSKATEVFRPFPGYDFAEILSCAYGTKGISDVRWRGFVRYVLEKGGHLPQSVLSDRENLLYFKGRLNQIRASLGEIDFYRFGEKDGMQKTIDLAMKAREGDTKADEELEALIKYEKEHDTPLLKQIGENFANGWMVVRLNLHEALK